MKPMLAPPRHSRMPTCTRVIGACASAGSAADNVAAIAARRGKRRMKENSE